MSGGRGVWEVRVYLGRDPHTGKERQVSKTIYGGSRSADDALRDLLDKAPSRTDGLGAIFGQLLDQWLAECERLDHSPTTLRTYRAQIKRTIRPTLGRIPLTRLSPKHLDTLYGKMKADGLTPKTIRNHHAIISAAPHQGVRWGWVRDNVADKAKPPKISQRRVSAPDIDVVRRIINAADERDPRLAPLFMLAALTGMRRGELCALRWSDIHLERAELDVGRSLVTDVAGLTEKTTKTDRWRKVALDPVAVALLEQHWARVTGWAQEGGTGLVPDAYVFSHRIDGALPFRPDNVTGFFIRIRDSLDIERVRLHDLRHFTATQLIGAGVDVRTVAGRLGHSDPSLTLRIYSHVIEERDRAAAHIMGQVLSPPPPQLPRSSARKAKRKKVDV